MRCFSLRTVGFRHDGKTLAWSPKTYSKEYPTWQLPCGKCLACRLEQARSTAVRCMHEASLYGDKNCFITATYAPENLKSPKLQYRDFQLFIKRLRSYIWESAPEENREKNRISVLTTGEYGDREKRPHWHALVFNFKPTDAKPKYLSKRGDQVYSSEILTKLWPHGAIDFGTVTFDSANYVARYATKKLYHGRDGTHDFTPVSRRSTKNAIGKKWIEKNWKDVFTHGYLVFRKGDQYLTGSIPRYYEKWLKKNLPEEWKHYVTEVKPKIQKEAQAKSDAETEHERRENFRRLAEKGWKAKKMRTKKESEEIILAQKFESMKQYLKL